MSNRHRLSLGLLAAGCLTLTVGCSSATRTTQAAPRPARASMVAADSIGAEAFADDTALAGDFRPYAGRLNGAADAALIHATYAGVEAD